MLSTEVTLLIAALMTGFLGSIHCIGMCGGIVGMLTMSLPKEVQQSTWALLPYLLLYNLGRISSYAIAGALVGWIGGQFTELLPQPHQVGMGISGVFMILLGLYLGAWWQALTVLERWGGYLWQRIEPLGRHFLPVRTPLQALGLGVVWGWLPCGLVYAALALALAAGQASSGSLVMVAFGIGTLPMLLTLGTTAHWFNRLTKQLWVRRLIGSLVIVLGLYTVLAPSIAAHYQLQLPNMCSVPDC